MVLIIYINPNGSGIGGKAGVPPLVMFHPMAGDSICLNCNIVVVQNIWKEQGPQGICWTSTVQALPCRAISKVHQIHFSFEETLATENYKKISYLLKFTHHYRIIFPWCFTFCVLSSKGFARALSLPKGQNSPGVGSHRKPLSYSALNGIYYNSTYDMTLSHDMCPTYPQVV